MTPVLAFDIETVPDCAGIRRLYDLPESLPDAEVAEVALQKRRTQTASDFLPPHLHRVVVISCVLRDDDGIKVFSLDEPEKDAIRRFYDGIEKYVPQLVSWNGGGFDLPVLNYRALLHGIDASRFWESGRNNYYGRYQDQHLDLMDVLAMYQPRNNARLDEVAQLAGLPGKIGMEGSAVWGNYLAGEIEKIRDYCEADALNTYLLYLRFQRMRGAFTPEIFKNEISIAKEYLQRQDNPHWREFLSRWNAA